MWKKKRIDCKSQQNNNPEMERGCGENSEEWWERGAKSRWEVVHRKERQARFPGSCDQLLRGNRQDLTLLIAHCVSEDSCLERERETLRSKNPTGRLGRYMYNFRISQWTRFCSLRAHSALIIEVSYKQGACCFFSSPTSTAFGSLWTALVRRVPLPVDAQASIHTNLLASYNILIYQRVMRNIYRMWRRVKQTIWY